MPSQYLSKLTGQHRTAKLNLHLGMTLAFVAGAINAGGFLAVKVYTSHMTGIISMMADDLALDQPGLALWGLMALLSFVAGAACCAILVNWARRKDLHGRYAIPLLLEAVLLLVFGAMGAQSDRFNDWFIPLTVSALCFLMGLQNAVITKISNSEIRTTHMTGIVTDLGIELGKMFYWNSPQSRSDLQPVAANQHRLFTLSLMVLMFFTGALAGAWGFKAYGHAIATAMAVFLLIISWFPVMKDLK